MFIASAVILELIMYSILSKTSSKMEKKFYLRPIRKLLVKYYFIALKQHLLPECQNFGIRIKRID